MQGKTLVLEQFQGILLLNLLVTNKIIKKQISHRVVSYCSKILHHVGPNSTGKNNTDKTHSSNERYYIYQQKKQRISNAGANCQ